jgi:hypothetical protein
MQGTAEYAEYGMDWVTTFASLRLNQAAIQRRGAKSAEKENSAEAINFSGMH